ncbi:uncharacterized protein LOC122428662 [Cervus canadensis]|uniref:uncharacterized protein LOC122428662 n=1 Tax=Cervus canadensis TaxID=1574408 RepID=UPI001CA33849|nr:uncharacterized protein LOC122428662 [Cervus canadensis]
MAQTVKTLPAMWETRVQSLDRDVLKKGHGNPLQDSCLQKPVDRGAWQAYSPWGHKERDTTERLPNANISRAHQPPRPQQEGATLLPILRHSAALLTGHTTNPDFRVLPPGADRQASTRAGPSARDLAHAPPSHCSSETGPHPRPPERLGLGCRPGAVPGTLGFSVWRSVYLRRVPPSGLCLLSRRAQRGWSGLRGRGAGHGVRIPAWSGRLQGCRQPRACLCGGERRAAPPLALPQTHHPVLNQHLVRTDPGRAKWPRKEGWESLLDRETFAPIGDISQCLETLLLVIAEGVTPTGRATSRTEAKYAPKPSAQDSLRRRSSQDQHTNSVLVEKMAQDSEENHCGKESVGKFHQRSVFFRERLASVE